MVAKLIKSSSWLPPSRFTSRFITSGAGLCGWSAGRCSGTAGKRRTRIRLVAFTSAGITKLACGQDEPMAGPAKSSASGTGMPRRY